MKKATLVYQGGIANVFEQVDGQRGARLLQHSFVACEWFCRGLRAAGVEVDVAWCNQAGDIADAKWNWTNFEDAPFSESFGFAVK